jgi:hypothetical protein
MFCPNCGQEQISKETKFCSRCGFLMSGVADVMANGGNLPYFIAPDENKAMSPRKRGFKKGLFIFLLSFLVVPLIAIFTIMVNAEPFAVVISAILLTVGGLLRIAYAFMFEEDNPRENTLEANVYQGAQNFLGKKKNAELLPQQSIPANSYIPPKEGNWRDTNDVSPSSVTDNTTKLLQKDELDK